ncbi:MAG: sigma-70 family RNA polymerase sigma factor, partial [Planctomycetes bacterium]|nr:sigma-70 family RNA polymerase sigma factor [Planctomycetota bacterium]
AQARYRLRGELGRLSEPADIVQDVWLRVLPRLDELTPEQRFTPVLVSYLSRAVLFQINNVMRTALRRRARGSAAAPDDGDWCEAFDERTGVVSAAVRSERRDAVSAAIEALGEEDREVVVLRAIEQHPNQVAAGMLGVDPGTLAVRYHRALKKLRDELPDSVFAEFADDDGSM